MRRLLTPTVLSAFLSIGISAHATPRLSASYGQDCHLCHVNPTGGGLRNDYVNKYVGPTELTLKPLAAHERTRWPEPKLNEQIRIGTDIRFLYLATDDVATQSRGALKNTFFQMQGDVYLAFEPSREFVLYLDRGIQGGYEVFMLGRFLPEHGYLKVGHFAPDIGWRWDDHNHYTREKLGLDFPGAAQAGIEVGVRPGPLVFSAGVFNGSSGGFGSLDDNSQKEFVGRGLYRMALGQSAQAALGASARVNRGSTFREKLWGILAQGRWGPLTYVGDFYKRRMEDVRDENAVFRSWLFTQELDLLVRDGVDVYVAWDYLDPDLDFATGTQTQITLGTRVYLRHYLKLEPLVRYEEGETVPGRRTNSRVEIILHGYY
ncbi:MAG TPA: hypothetical protein VGB22_10040 [candidate division Zixibacteria bacterium]|jgi:hypothetical protein